MMIRKITVGIGLSLFASLASAQIIYYEDQALMYSQTELQGSARIQAIGGAQVTLGGEIGSFGINPAGIGFYRGSDIGISMQYDNQSTTSTYFGTQTEANRGSFVLPQIGIVFGSSRRPNDGSFNRRWNNFAFGVNYNRSHTFNGQYIFDGFNTSSGITDYFAYLANEGGVVPEEPEFIQDAAWNAGIIDEDEDGRFYGAGESGEHWQYGDVITKGSLSETNFTVGGNYSNQLYLGLAVGLVNVRQEYDIYYTEEEISDPRFNLNYFDYYRENKTTGTGINVKAGFIYRTRDDFRIGASIQTPTWLNLEEDNTEEIVATGNDYISYVFDYKIRTPFKANAGLAKFFADKGFITADIEYVDYSSSEFDSDDNNINRNVNESISGLFTDAINIRLGGEYRLENNLNLRAGYAYFGSSDEEDSDNFFVRHYFTGGLGYRYQNIYADLTGIYNSQFNTTATAYEPRASAQLPFADIERNRLGIMLTVGTRF